MRAPHVRWKCGMPCHAMPFLSEGATNALGTGSVTSQPRTSFFFSRMYTVGAQYVLSGSDLVACRSWGVGGRTLDVCNIETLVRHGL